ncbi:2Fe-2S iron-sulfur cluster binding domain-containing protein [Sorangium atrum]|uniref:2Fe-2S iron-sulfur cluster binding domain-containing protein n=1 Tax=Sorangium atrum TaxID=2995308 RepID=A0ABT5CAB5_9BACT|nr:2Fe-2S iron-sulfur cluster binding domain-containing protein [Sorangium aterium]MDC0683374.1 2Fe-2S iron-sulfur cluster binding domain-containing protein [Sorangium aterium]
MKAISFGGRTSGRAGTLHVLGSDRAARIEAGETLLSAAVRGNISFPHMCNAGECGTCKCRLIRGHIRLKSDISRHVAPEELSAGFVLACQSLAVSEDVAVEVPGTGRGRSTRPAPVQIDASVARVTPLSPSVLALEVDLTAEVDYVAGQVAQLTVPGVPGLDKPRCYSFAEAPDRASPRRALFHVRHVPGGAFTDWLFGADRTGARLCFSGPHGTFRYHEADRPLLCVAGGTGLSPIKAILEQGISDGLARDVTLVVGARTRQDLYALDAIASIKKRWRGRFVFVPVLSQEPEGSSWTGRKGHVTDYLRGVAAGHADCAAYVCGPPGMIDAALDVLRGEIPPKHLHHDRFLDRGSVAGAASAVA